MALTITLTPDTEARLAAKARAAGVDTSTYAAGVLKSAAIRPTLDEILATAQASTANQYSGQTGSTASFGLRLSDLNPSLTHQYGLSQESGALVVGVDPNSSAAQAGIRTGDLITQINKQKIDNAKQAQDAYTKTDLKTGVSIQIENRQGSELVYLKSNPE